MKFGKLLDGVSDKVDNVAEKTGAMKDRVFDSFNRDIHYAGRILDKEGNAAKNAAHIFFDGNNSRSINNLYTGYGLSASGKTIVGAGIGVYAASQIGDLEYEVKERARNNYIKQQQEEQDIESPLASRSDGQGYKLDLSQLVANVQSQGDLVFALNKTRNGGYL